MTRGFVVRPPRRLARRACGAVIGLSLAGWLSAAGPAWSRTASGDRLDGVVQITATIPPDARTASALGTERQGTGVVIDDSGLILTIGYLILEAIDVQISGPESEPVGANIVAYDHESGFGLVRAERPLHVAPIALGNSATLKPMQPLLVVSRSDKLDATGVYVVDRRDFAGYWEYLLEDAIFTAPPHAGFGGAALLDQDGRLVGIGSLLVNDAGFQDRPVPGNMFVPIDQLKPIMSDLLANGRRSDPPQPWLGLFLEEYRGRLFVTEVAPEGPAATAGIRPNDLVLGIGGTPVEGLIDFYRKLWSRGAAGIEVPLDLLRGMGTREVAVKSGNRYRYLKLNPSY
jgi:S1-C subfamily serine protease